jgi:hypothetical protein
LAESHGTTDIFGARQVSEINTPQAALILLDALAAALPHAPHRAEFDIVADAADDLRAALKREEEALAWLEERRQHWRRELDRMRSP